MTVRVGVIGCGGRMGTVVLQALAAAPEVTIAGAVEREGHPLSGRDLGSLTGGPASGALVGTDLQALLARAHVIVEFSSPEASLAHAERCAEAGCAHVIGTTGLSDAQRGRLEELAARTAIVWSGNMSQGVNLLQALVEQAARALGADFDIEIVEMHHRHKVDAPSGTALMLGEAAAKGRGVDLASVRESGRDGHTGARAPGAIGFAALRGGDVIGDHSVIFAGAGERIEFTHKASDRIIYARGAVRAALWAAKAPPGFYGMADVLGMTAPGR
ncbi:MAG: 4-hydroxy-tetrahydrodipicolinate reductase [Geminicoccaceae bacterium]|nr:4-hydroxy-tetrahydrodipicolinate reductase [Geminicoccaceae bacterium]